MEALGYQLKSAVDALSDEVKKARAKEEGLAALITRHGGSADLSDALERLQVAAPPSTLPLPFKSCLYA